MLPAILGIVSAATAIGGGVSANKSAKAQSSLMEQQGQLQYEDALREAAGILDDGRRFQQKQMMEYISSGVEIQGTPLLVSSETMRMAEKEAEYTEKHGTAQRSLSQDNAKITRSEGKAALIGSIGSAIGSGVGTYTQAGGTFGKAE